MQNNTQAAQTTQATLDNSSNCTNRRKTNIVSSEGIITPTSLYTKKTLAALFRYLNSYKEIAKTRLVIETINLPKSLYTLQQILDGHEPQVQAVLETIKPHIAITTLDNTNLIKHYSIIIPLPADIARWPLQCICLNTRKDA